MKALREKEKKKKKEKEANMRELVSNGPEVLFGG